MEDLSELDPVVLPRTFMLHCFTSLVEGVDAEKSRMFAPQLAQVGGVAKGFCPELSSDARGRQLMLLELPLKVHVRDLQSQADFNSQLL